MRVMGQDTGQHDDTYWSNTEAAEYSAELQREFERDVEKLRTRASPIHEALPEWLLDEIANRHPQLHLHAAIEKIIKQHLGTAEAAEYSAELQREFERDVEKLRTRASTLLKQRVNEINRRYGL